MTIAVANTVGSNGVTVDNAILDKVEALECRHIPGQRQRRGEPQLERSVSGLGQDAGCRGRSKSDCRMGVRYVWVGGNSPPITPPGVARVAESAYRR